MGSGPTRLPAPREPAEVLSQLEEVSGLVEAVVKDVEG